MPTTTYQKEKEKKKEKIKGAVLIFSCQKHVNTRLKDLIIPQMDGGWILFTVIGDPFLSSDYDIMETAGSHKKTLFIKCEDSYIHVMKKVVFTMKVLMEIYDVEEGFLRCGDDLVFNQTNLTAFLQFPNKQDYMGIIALKVPGIFRHYNTFMTDYYEKHVEDFSNPAHGLTKKSLKDIQQLTHVPLCSYTGGVVTYLSKKSCDILVDHMNFIHWDVFQLNADHGYPYIIEDIGIGYVLAMSKIEPCACELYTNDPSRFQFSLALHTNNYKYGDTP